MESEKRVTCQKKIILDYLKSVQTHPSAEIIFKKVRKKLPRISLGTVYRNLNVMKERGDILEISSQIARYDGDVSPHSHFVCEKCGKIFDVFQKIKMPKLNKIKVEPVKHIKNYQIYFYGACKKC